MVHQPETYRDTSIQRYLHCTNILSEKWLILIIDRVIENQEYKTVAISFLRMRNKNNIVIQCRKTDSDAQLTRELNLRRLRSDLLNPKFGSQKSTLL